MARRIATDVKAGLRDHLTEQCAIMLARMSQAEGFPYRGAEVERLRDRLIDLKAGRDILVYRFEIPADMQPPRDDRQHIYTLRGDRLITADYERMVPSFDRW